MSIKNRPSARSPAKDVPKNEGDPGNEKMRISSQEAS